MNAPHSISAPDRALDGCIDHTTCTGCRSIVAVRGLRFECRRRFAGIGQIAERVAQHDRGRTTAASPRKRPRSLWALLLTPAIGLAVWGGLARWVL